MKNVASRPQDSVSHQTASSVLWLTGQKWALRLSGLATIAVLTRLLTPEDFGTVAAASTVLPFFALVADLGFAAYIVQAEKVDRVTLSTAFWYAVAAGIVLCAGLVAVAPLLGIVFRNPDVVPVLQVLSLTVVLTAAGAVPTAILRRSMRFAAIASQGATAAVLAQVTAVALAFTGFGVWALVGQTLVSALVGAVLAWVAAKWRPRLLFSRRDFAVMASFGSKVLGVEFVAMLRAWAEAAIISATLGTAALGYMNIAQRLVQIVQDLTGGAIVPVTTVAFSRVRATPARLREAYVRALRFTYATLSLPLMMVAVAAPLVVPIVFGQGWEQSYRVAQILAVAGTLTVGAALDHALHYGMGRAGAWFLYAVVIDALTVGVTALVAPHGLEAVAWGFLAVAVVATAARWFFVPRLLGARAGVALKPFGLLLAAVAVSGAFGWLTMMATASLPDILSLVLIGIVMTATHLLVIQLLAPSVLREVGVFLRRIRDRRRSRGMIEPEETISTHTTDPLEKE